MSRTVIIGDVHGCREELEALVHQVGVTRDDEVVLVGDLVAKGPDSPGVLRFVREHGFRAVLGNHDAYVVDIARGRSKKPAKPAHADVAAALTPQDVEWLERRPLYLELPHRDVIVVHAGLVPGVPLADQDRNYLMNLRSITRDGEPSKRIEDGTPWAASWPGPAHVVFGHDAVRGLQQHPFATGLDTGCVYGKRLTALVLPERQLISVPARAVYSVPGE